MMYTSDPARDRVDGRMFVKGVVWGSFFCFGSTTRACGVLVPQPGVKPAPPAVDAHSLNHWTPREGPGSFFLVMKQLIYIHICTCNKIS